jgi:hypothetical protein
VTEATVRKPTTEIVVQSLLDTSRCNEKGTLVVSRVAIDKRGLLELYVRDGQQETVARKVTLPRDVNKSDLNSLKGHPVCAI